MSVYMVIGYKENSGKIQESQTHLSYSAALHEAHEFLKSDQYKNIVIVCDQEGSDHPANAGKFFLERIIK